TLVESMWHWRYCRRWRPLPATEASTGDEIASATFPLASGKIQWYRASRSQLVDFGASGEAANVLRKRRHRDHVVAAIDGVQAVEVERNAAGFRGNNFERREVPRLRLSFDPDVRPSGGDKHGVKAPAHAADRPEFRKPFEQIRGKWVTVNVTEAGAAEQGVGASRNRGRMNAPAIPKCAFSFGGGKHFVGGREVGEPGDDLAVLFEPEKDAPGARAADEVARAIDGVDDPAAAVGGFAAGAFLAQESVAREGLLETFDDELFAFAVGDGDRGFVGLRFNADVAFPDLQGEGAGAAGDIGSDG